MVGGRVGLIVLMAGTMLLFLYLLPVASQSTPAERPDSRGDESAVAKPKKKPSLAELTRVNTEEAARSAANKRNKGKTASQPSGVSNEPDVLELQPSASNHEEADSGAAVKASGSKKSPVKNVHGAVYGAADPEHPARAAGGAVGASSKGGKTSVYIETDRSRNLPSSPR